MRAAEPEVAQPRHRLGRRLRRLLLARIGGVAVQQLVDLAGLEAERGEVDAELGQLAGFQRQQLLVPAGALGELVVGEDQRPLLRRR